MSAWPSDVPFFTLRRGFSHVEADTVLRTQMDDGDRKSRPRMTAARRSMTGSANMTLAQYRDAREFVDTDLAGGALTFTATDPITGVTQTYQLMSPLRIVPDGLGFLVSAQLDILP